MHRKLLSIVALAVLLPGLAVGVAAAHGSDADVRKDGHDDTFFLRSEETDFTFVSAAGETFDESTAVLEAVLSGANEVDAAGNPAVGDPDGSGHATVRLNSATGEVCWDLTVAGLALPAVGAHIHVGAAGVNGDIVVPLDAPGTSGSSNGCTTADPAVVAAIATDTAGYYVNVHTTEFPDGAVRGQLQMMAPDDEEFGQAGDRFFFREDVFASDAEGTKGAQVGSAFVQCTFGIAASLHCQGAVDIDGKGQLHVSAALTDVGQTESGPFDVAIVGGTGEFHDAGGDATLTETTVDDTNLTHWEIRLLELDDDHAGKPQDS
jgi:hypothetical protein